MIPARPCRPADNPFASHRVETLRFRGCAVPWFELERRIDVLGGRAAIVGPKGSGKTTLLEELCRRLQPPVILVRSQASDLRPYRTAIQQLPKPVTEKHTILVDGAEQLGALGWRRFMNRTRRARRLVATLHQPGRLSALLECSTSAGLLHDLVRELAPENTISLAPALDDLFHRHGGNIRMCLRELFDEFAGRRENLRRSGSSGIA